MSYDARWIVLLTGIAGFMLVAQVASRTEAATVTTLYVQCNAATAEGQVEVPAHQVRAQVALASNLGIVLDNRVFDVQPDGSYRVELEYPAQVEGTRLIVAIGEWDGQQYLRPATMTSQVCQGGGALPTPTPTLLPSPTPPPPADYPKLSITIGPETSATACSASGWSILYDRATMLLDIDASSLMRYFVQTVNGDVNLVHFWGSGYDAYIQDYWISGGTQSNMRASASYAVPLWSDSYQAETIEYVVQGDAVIWELRATLACDHGAVSDYILTSHPVNLMLSDLPVFTHNLVLALDDIPRYRDPFNQTDYLGTIKACQTFFISAITMPRASISVWATDSLTRQPMLLNGPNPPRIVDVAENYGQRGGQPILPQCAGR